jgi:hypothetical protein
MEIIYHKLTLTGLRTGLREWRKLKAKRDALLAGWYSE